MDNLILKETNKTPSVNFNPELGKFDISGKSVPENSMSFYGPILDYIDIYSQTPADKTILNVKFEYFNTSSSNKIHTIFKKFEKVYMHNKDVLIRWYYETGDDNMLEAGRDFKAIIGVPFEIVKVDEL